MTHTFMVQKAKLGKKGQFTIPKRMRDEDNLQEDDVFVVTHMPSGEYWLRKTDMLTPEDRMLDAIRKAPRIDAEAAWKEVREERRRERS